MANVLFISRKDLFTIAPLSGNIDDDKWRYRVLDVQEMHLQQLIGSRLYNKIKTDIEGAALAGAYKTLVDDYIKRYVAMMTASYYVSIGAYTVGNAGVFKHEPETGTPATDREISGFAHRIRDTAEFYGKRMIDYICANNSSFPEYNQWENGDVNKSNDNINTGWVL
jgi:hypothetical protein